MPEFEEWEWLLDRYVNEELAFKRYENLYDNDFSSGNCERCFGYARMNAYCGRCYQPEQCVFKNGKLVSINCPTIVQFTSIGGKYLYNELYIKIWLDAGGVRGLYPQEYLENGDTTEGSVPPPEFEDWKRIKFVAGGLVFTMIRGESPKLLAKMKEIYLEQVEIEF